MKKYFLILAAIFLLASCHKEPFERGNDYVVYTSPSDDVNFSQFKTFYIPDSLLIIGANGKSAYSKDDAADELIEAFKSSMIKAGYQYSDKNADLGVQMSYIIKTDSYLLPSWWYDYPGYWSPNYWGYWNYYYLARPIVYSYTTNALITDIVDLTNAPQPGAAISNDDGQGLEILWTSYIGGPAGGSLRNDIDRMEDAIEQAFDQSPYLKK